MADESTATLMKLGDSGQTIAAPGKDVRGRHVVDAGGEELGKVDDLLIDSEEHKVRFLRVEHGGILGIGATATFIPVEAVSDIDDDTVRVDLTRQKIEQAPTYDPEVVDDTGYYAELYGYYGYPPFFGPGITPVQPLPPIRR
ncbi:Sporulation protein YlmC, PRC-barrel domain family [Micromonospora nigra]|uniref:Sporulation protein YlmC, PRC-barrel domain family n=1 Tax=Micromonospora nigra TaxID=145857 RepID=A0A1C6RBD9_9ACTN|nr:PRC-barrel domain-containing protein [Micromonospora nigra]SCL14308.1 Sporulation protein YlmC, PRC-barrel domain family [Micromonospora nigra]